MDDPSVGLQHLGDTFLQVPAELPEQKIDSKHKLKLLLYVQEVLSYFETFVHTVVSMP